MKVFYILLFIALFGVSSMAQSYKCLGSGVDENSVSGFRTQTSKTGETYTVKITVKHTLKSMRARCRQGKLVDRNGRQIRFYFLKGCWGSPPDDYSEILDQQQKKIERLKKRYTVIEIPCNPDPMLPPAFNFLGFTIGFDEKLLNPVEVIT